MMAVHAPDSSKSLEMYEACISSVIKVLREGRPGGAADFYIKSDLNVELGMMSTDEKDIEELEVMYGPLCWQGYDKDPGGFKKLMWYGIMEEFNCKVTSTWSVCGRAKETAFTHKHLSKKKETSKLDYIVGPMRRKDEVYIRNDVRTCATWDHYPISLPGYRMRNKQQNFPEGKRKKWTGCKPKTDEQTIEFRRNVMEKGDDKSDEDLVAIQQTIEIAAADVAHHTKAERKKYRVRQIMLDYVRKPLRGAI